MLTKKRQGEIALLLIKNLINNEPILASSLEDTDEKLRNIAKSINIEVDELFEFLQPLYVKALEKALEKAIFSIN